MHLGCVIKIFSPTDSWQECGDLYHGESRPHEKRIGKVQLCADQIRFEQNKLLNLSFNTLRHNLKSFNTSGPPAVFVGKAVDTALPYNLLGHRGFLFSLLRGSWTTRWCCTILGRRIHIPRHATSWCVNWRTWLNPNNSSFKS